ncbi:phosphopantetheine-binding protein [Streptomyces sp. NPDC059499]|uniref:acyl carrier protein n=1 Tax=Streptomyces sp. NPDC059499 TaxID=3346852 RepID=UPI00368B2487
MDQGWMVLGAAAVGAAGATLAALTAGRASGRQAVLQSAGQQQQWRRQLRRDTYGALLGAGAEARDELGAIFADLRRADPTSEEGLTRIRARLGETKPLINAVRLATAKVYVEGPDSVLETAMRIEEGLVLFHTGLTALAELPPDEVSNGPAMDTYAAAYLATCTQQRVAIHTVLREFATAARHVLDGEGNPRQDSDNREVRLDVVPTPPAVEDVDRILATVVDILGIAHHPLDLDRTIFELGANSLTVLELATRMRNDYGLQVPVRFFFEQGSIRGMTAALAVLHRD